MVDILELLVEKRECNDPNDYEDYNYILKAVKQSESDIYIVLKEGIVQNSELDAIKVLNEQYFVIEEFSLGRPFINSEFHFSLVHARKEKREKYIVGIFNGATYDSDTIVGRGTDLRCPPVYNSYFLEYLKKIEEWINNNVELIDEKYWRYEFSTVDYPERIRVPRDYSKRSNLVKQLLTDNSVVLLSEVAEVYKAKTTFSEDYVNVVDIDEQKPYRYDNLLIRHGYMTNVKIKVGDILFPGIAVDSKPYLVTEKTINSGDMYAASNIFVIRPKNIMPEYLWMYLISDVAICVYERFYSNRLIRILGEKELEDFPIIKPVLPSEEYINLCEIFKDPTERHYQTFMISTYEQLRTGKIDSVNEVLSVELWNRASVFHSDQLDNMLRNDLRELNICYQNTAYKAVLILAGSILEAVLIDWLSEINRVDYFSHDYMVPNRSGGYKRADLIDYIDAIKYIKRPNWARLANEAHRIRQKRNRVHAKLCLNSVDDNAQTCMMVIEYLKHVLRSRGINVRDNLTI